MHVLDTDTLTLLGHGHTSVVGHALRLPPNSLAVAIVTVEEVFIGRYTQIRRARSGQLLVHAYGQLLHALDLFRAVTVLPFSQAASDRFDFLRPQHRRIGANDLRIAAVALEASATLVTRNAADFQGIAGLTVVAWSV